MKVFGSFAIQIALFLTCLAHGNPQQEAAHRALLNLTDTGETGTTLPLLAGHEVFEKIWKIWDNQSLVSQMQNLNVEGRRKAVFDHYGLIANPVHPELPLGFNEKKGLLTFNCLACHAGQVQNQVVIGLGNHNVDLRGLLVDMARLYPFRQVLLKKLAKNFGPERGLITSLGIEDAALQNRDANMNFKIVPNQVLTFADAGVNAPPWWNLNYKTHVFADGVLPVTPRFFIASAADIVGSGDSFRAQEPFISDVFELARSIPSPKYPGSINMELAHSGKIVFDNTCAKCHGHYSEMGIPLDYPERSIAAEKVGTDSERVFPADYAQALDFFQNSWMMENAPAVLVPTGYVAPPLQGIWATAPYLHNGSVPTLWTLLNSEERPVFWRQSSSNSDYDLNNVGLVYSVVSEPPEEARRDSSLLSRYYDTRKKGRGAQGHTFPEVLSQAEKIQVLEYLKTL